MDTYTANPTLFIETANRAINIVASTVRPVLAKYTVTQAAGETEEEYVVYDIEELTKDGNVKVFAGFSDMDSSVKHRTEHQKYLLLDASFNGDFEVWYKKTPERITEDTPDDFEIELDYDVAVLVPYLMCHDLWMDDDVQKAVMYYNKYDDLKNQVLVNQSKDTVATVVAPKGWCF